MRFIATSLCKPGISKPDTEMLLLFKLLAEENKAEKEDVDSTADGWMLPDLLPGSFHFFAPVNIVKNKDRIVMDLFKKLVEVVDS